MGRIALMRGDIATIILRDILLERPCLLVMWIRLVLEQVNNFLGKTTAEVIMVIFLSVKRIKIFFTP